MGSDTSNNTNTSPTNNSNFSPWAQNNLSSTFGQNNEWSGIDLSSFPSLQGWVNNRYGSPTTSTPTSPTVGGNTNTYPTATANLGANLDPRYYDPKIAAQLPANLPGGGGGLVTS
jgi:hypothetical protein